MLRHLVLAILLSLWVAPTPATAQQAPFTTVECSQHIRAVGRPAVRAAAALDSAIASFDAEARRLHGANTGFTYRGGEALAGGGRLSLTCSRRAGRNTCTASGRTCAWVTTTVPNTSVAARCRDGYTHFGGGGCGQTQRREPVGTNNPFIVVAPRAFALATCPARYELDPADGSRCLRRP